MDAALIRQCVTADLERRLKILPADIKIWTERAVLGGELPLHVTQMQTLHIMMDELISEQLKQMTILKGITDSIEFAETYQELLVQLSGSMDVWKIFSNIFDQRQSNRIKASVDLADLIAWSSYDAYMSKARKWGIVKEDEYREPPLTYLESSLTPATASRGEKIELLSMSLRHYRDLVLPIPIVLYPRDQAESIWMMCAIAHEVGHNLDYDLDTRVGVRLTDEYRQKLIGRVADERRTQWRRWMNEIFADAIALLLCQAGYAISMCFWLTTLGPGEIHQELDPTAEHPPLYLRLLLLAEMLIVTEVDPLVAYGNHIKDLWQTQPRPIWQSAYENEVHIIAMLILREKISPLDNNALIDFIDDPKFSFNRTSQLASHWVQSTAAPNFRDSKFPFYLIPSAAAMAVERLQTFEQFSLDYLHQKVLAYVQHINIPVFLPADTSHKLYLKDLSRKIRFSSRVQKEEEKL